MEPIVVVVCVVVLIAAGFTLWVVARAKPSLEASQLLTDAVFDLETRVEKLEQAKSQGVALEQVKQTVRERVKPRRSVPDLIAELENGETVQS